MKRQLIAIGLAVLALSMFFLISATLAAPVNVPSLQSIDESEPNNEFSEADDVPVPGYANGDVEAGGTATDTLDYFVGDTEIGQKYQVRLSILNNEGELDVILRLYNSDTGFLDDDSSTNPSISWTAYQSSHYFEIEAFPPPTGTISHKVDYRLTINLVAPTPTATNSPTPSATSTPPSDEDEYEPNDGFGQSYELPVATTVELDSLLGNANFVPAPSEGTDEDWFKFWAKEDKWYEATTSELSGVDTKLQIRDRNDNGVDTDDDGAGGYASRIRWQADYDGYYYIRITNKVDTTGSYNLTLEEVAEPTPGPSPTPGPNVDSDADDCENNFDFDNACVIAANKSETFNFVPPFGGMVDNDYYKLWIKPGFIYQCATSDLDPGIDPNMIVYDQNRNGIGGNDDIEPGDFNSSFSYFATYEGWLYLLLGTGDRTPADIYNSDYTLRCEVQVPGEDTKTPTATPDEAAQPTATTRPQTGTSAPPTATPTPEGLTVRVLTTPTSVPAEPAATPRPRFLPISLLIYYDANNDNLPGAGEGIGGISAQAYEAATNQLLAQGFTDAQGSLEFTVAAQGPVRVSVPFFGFSQLVAGEGASIYLRVPPTGAP